MDILYTVSSNKKTSKTFSMYSTIKNIIFTLSISVDNISTYPRIEESIYWSIKAIWINIKIIEIINRF